MTELARIVLKNPVLGCLVVLCLLLVVGLIVSDWMEKRRARAFLKLYNESKAALNPHAASAHALESETANANVSFPASKPRIARWSLATVLVIASVLIILHGMTKPGTGAQAGVSASASIPAPTSQSEGKSSTSSFLPAGRAISFRCRTQQAPLQSVTLRLNPAIDFTRIWPSLTAAEVFNAEGDSSSDYFDSAPEDGGILEVPGEAIGPDSYSQMPGFVSRFFESAGTGLPVRQLSGTTFTAP